MKVDDARELYRERRHDVSSGWKLHPPEKDVNEHFREVELDCLTEPERQSRTEIPIPGQPG